MIALAPVGVVLIAIVLWDAFETMVLPRRVDRRFRLARLFFRSLWYPWRAVALRLATPGPRDSVLAVFGPFSILTLFVLWAAGLVFGFAILYQSLGDHLAIGGHGGDFGTALYMSGSTFVTLGLGDVTPTNSITRAVTVIEAGTGFGFLALVIGYLPVLYQSFSRRELYISLLDARAGSPPSAGEMLRRYSESKDKAELERLLLDSERWAADLLESHVSYPVVAYFRSQHDHQSWLGAITAILDFSGLVLACAPDRRMYRPAELAFAMSRHTVVDLAQAFGRELQDPDRDRLPPDDVVRLNGLLGAAGLKTLDDPEAAGRLATFRAMYEPYVYAISVFSVMALPPWIPRQRTPDDWQTSDRESVLPTVF